MIGTRVHITGIVQGVGFRPFVYNQALRHGLTGWVRNTSAGVDIEVNGEPDRIAFFIENLKSKAPPLSSVDSIEYQQIPFVDCNQFVIVESQEISNAFQPISPDISICPDCLSELFDPENRRYHYPFINCTNCGPRLTIIEDIPYDRQFTTMKEFEMCGACKAEYTNPTDRRFHAQPIACPVCGPHIWIEEPNRNNTGKHRSKASGDEALLKAKKLLKRGRIVVIKGLGGFHLACDATNPKAVTELRSRKLRVDKPFAVMVPDITSVEHHCLLNETDRELIGSIQRPIVILTRREKSSIALEVSPRQTTLGVMLPYTPLHYLLFAGKDGKRSTINNHPVWDMPPLVMTSGNLSEEPIAIDNNEALERLSGLADAFLFHDRSIRTRCDDSVIRTFQGVTFPLRRSRGYAPFPVYLKSDSPQVLAVGAELKNTFCVTRDRYAFLSQHIGDMENIETLESFTNSITNYESLFRVNPKAIAYDLHPNYLATRYALERSKREDLPAFGIQHHHAHITSCMAENGLDSGKSVIGVAFDGTGYGDDGAIWGGEFLLADYRSYTRVGHLKYIPLPGGDAATRKPARTALAYLWASNIEWDPDYPPVFALCAEERSILKSQLDKKINSPLTSSMGRLFDAAASMAGLRHQVNYEAQAAIEFESMADPDEIGEYNFMMIPSIESSVKVYQIDAASLIYSLLDDVQKSTPQPAISARFHNGIARMVAEVCNKLRGDHDINDIVLSGGVWQNLTLLQRTYSLLESENFNVYVHKLVPTNDGGLALGQAISAIRRMAK